MVNCNPLYTVHELSHIVSNAGAEIIVTLDLKQIFEKAEALVEAGHVKQAHRLPLPRRPAAGQEDPLHDRQAQGPRRRSASSPAAAATRGIADLDRPQRHADAGRPSTSNTDVAVQQYTGGTTGLPKGAMLSHANIAANMSQIDAWGCGLFYPPSKVVAVLPFFHIFAMTVCMNVPLCNGTQVVMLPRFELKGFLDC